MRSNTLYGYAPPVTTHESLRRIVRSVIANGGHTEQLPTRSIPDHGYMVAVEQRFEQSMPLAAFNVVALTQYVVKHADPLRNPNYYLGVWVDGFDEPNAQRTVYLDVSERFTSLREALHAGRVRNQLAIYDIGMVMEISL